MKVNAKGIRANVQQTVTVYTLKRGNMQFGKGFPMSVKCSFFDIVISRVADDPAAFWKDGGKIVARRVKRETVTEKAV